MTGRKGIAAGHWFNASWLAQQATEKALKALFVERKICSLPYTHDLERLGCLLSVPAAVDADLTLINPAFDLVRYPDPTGNAPVDLVGPVIALEHLEAAERVLVWVRQELP